MAKHVCPAWLGWMLASPVRRLLQNPDAILKPFIREGMTVLEPGSAMGFFTLPAARMVGPNGRVIAVDLQEKMIAGLRQRAARAGLKDRIETRVCPEDTLNVGDLAGRVDLVLAIAVVHEVPDAGRFFREIAVTLKSGATCLLIEPQGEVNEAEFRQSLDLAGRAGLKTLTQHGEKSRRYAVLRKARGWKDDGTVEQ